MRHLLLIDPVSKSRVAIQKIGEKEGWTVDSLSSGFDALAWLAINRTDLILMSMDIPMISPVKVLHKMKRLLNRVPVILIADENNYPKVTEGYQAGAYNILFKPLSPELLVKNMEEAMSFKELSSTMKRPDLLHTFLQGYGDLNGNSKASQELYVKIDRILDSAITVMITGDSGTGKEVTAKTIHRYGSLKAQPFVSVNCAAIPESLQESELFGYDKGAFTGAYADKVGKFEAANNGTLFLDEIGDMSLPLQAKILRFIETGELERVGGIVKRGVSVRLIAATNKNLQEEVREKRFREDLYHRINVYPIELPSLRDRKDDIAILASLILKKIIGTDKKHISILPETYDLLNKNDWQGNVRELINSLNRAIVNSKEGVLRVEDFSSFGETLAPKEISAEDEIVTEPITTLKNVERNAILNALRFTDGNIQRASKALGITRATMYNKLKRYNVTIKREIREPNSQEV